MVLENKNISTYLVGSALGSSSRDVGTLCTHKSINIWSKWKPIESNVDTMTLDELKYKKFGLTIIEANTPKLLVDAINNNGGLGFKYNAARTKFRLGDFRNYNSTAPVPCEKTYLDGEEINIGGVTSSNHGSYERECGGIETMSTNTTIGVDDLYFEYNQAGEKKRLNRGFYITDGTNSEWYTGKFYWWTTNMQRFANKDVTIYEFYANCSKGSDGIIRHPNSSSTGAWATDRFYAIPYPKYTKHIKKETPAGSKVVSTELLAKFVERGTSYYDSVDWSVQFSAVGSVYRGGTISNVWIKLCRDKKGLDIIEQHKIAETIQVPDETTSMTYKGNLKNRAIHSWEEPDSLVWVIVWYNYNIEATTMPEMEMRPDIQMFNNI